MQASRRTGRGVWADASRDALLEVLDRLTPGTPLRTALDRVVDQGSGALVVLGSGPEVDRVCTGGFVLQDSPFTPARLAELCKMDGAIVLDDSCERILRANVHLHPDATMPTDETGSRHRSAERVARQTGKAVVAVSEERGLTTLYLGDAKHTLRDPAELKADVNQSLVTLDRIGRRLDEAVERLTRLEVADQMTYRTVVLVLHRAELVLRIGERVDRTAVGLGVEGHLIEVQLDELVHGVGGLRDAVLKDYVRPSTEDRLRAARSALEALPADHLTRPERVAAALGFEHLDAPVRPLGFRLLSHVPRLPEAVREGAVRHFEDFQAILAASVDQLGEVEGIGRTRAQELRGFLDRLLDSQRVAARQEGF